MSNQIEDLRRWLDTGAGCRLLEVADGHVVVELLTCHGEPVDQLEPADPELIRWYHRIHPESGDPGARLDSGSRSRRRSAQRAD